MLMVRYRALSDSNPYSLHVLYSMFLFLFFQIPWVKKGKRSRKDWDKRVLKPDRVLFYNNDMCPLSMWKAFKTAWI